MAPNAKRAAEETEEPFSDEPELSSHSDDHEFALERILAQRLVNGVMRYLVKWEGYDDSRCTWEPRKSFTTDQLIVKEWKDQLANGDTLDDETLQAVEDRMEEAWIKLERRSEKKKQELLRRKQQKAEAKPQAKEEVQTCDKVDKQQQDTTRGQQPPNRTTLRRSSETILTTSKTPQPGSLTTYTESNQNDAAPQKFHAPWSVPYRKRASSPTSRPETRSKPAGKRFKNLRHWNNAQKKAKEERVPSLYYQGLAQQSSTNPATRNADDPPPDATRDDSPLFFPDATDNQQSSDARSLFSSVSGSSPVPSRDSAPPSTEGASPDIESAPPPIKEAEPPPSNQSDLPHNSQPTPPPTEGIRPLSKGPALFHNRQLGDAGPLPPSQTTKQTFFTNSGRAFASDELLVRLSFGEHQLGDALVLRFPNWLRARMKKLKQGHTIFLHFEQSLVFNSPDFSGISRSWPPEVVANGAIKPFEDNQKAFSDLAGFLEQHDVAALWEDPEPDSPIGLILHSPRSTSWRRFATDPVLRSFPLVLHMRNRARRGDRPVSIRPEQAATAAHQKAAPLFPLYSQQRSVPTPPQIQDSPLQHISSETTTLKPDSAVLPPTLKERAPKPTESRRNRQSSPAEILKAAEVLEDTENAALPTDIFREQGASSTDMIDWSVNADFRSLIRATSTYSGKPFVWIAFEEQCPKQAGAMKKWAGTHTSTRRVYTDTDGERVWKEFREDFQGSKTPALLFFHEDEPSFCWLEAFNKLVGLENVFCHNVSWTDEGKVAKYTFSPIFPRSTVLYIPEWTITNHPDETVFALRWFSDNSKGKKWKIMVRPNVRAWLQETAVRCENTEKARKLFDILVLLFDLSAGLDVTVAEFADNARLLGAGTSHDPKGNDFIVPLPSLPGYDDSPEADSTPDAIRNRDELLRDHFIYWTFTTYSTYRKFIALDDSHSHYGQGSRQMQGTEYIKFWKPVDFMRDLDKSDKGKSGNAG